ncbi:putative nuclease HARBI1 [Trichonephila clavipes]|nr:putative nuclease HARBI1 [Trichonephila clavipes]
MDDHFDSFLLEDLETLESIERRSVFIPEHRNNDLDELDEDDFRRRYRFYKGTIETLVKLLRTKLDPATGRNHSLTAAEKVLAAVRFFAFGNRQINVGDLHSISQPSTSRAITDVARAPAELRPQYIYLPQTEDERMQIRQKLYREFEFPGIYGALDCSLIKILNPGGSLAETFRCRKGFFALNVQTVSDPNLSIRNIVVRWPGSIMQLTHEQEMSKRFSCIDTPFRCSLETAQTVIVATAETVIVATAVLHNLALSLGDYEDERGFPSTAAR